MYGMWTAHGFVPEQPLDPPDPPEGPYDEEGNEFIEGRWYDEADCYIGDDSALVIYLEEQMLDMTDIGRMFLKDVAERMRELYTDFEGMLAAFAEGFSSGMPFSIDLEEVCEYVVREEYMFFDERFQERFGIWKYDGEYKGRGSFW